MGHKNRKTLINDRVSNFGSYLNLGHRDDKAYDQRRNPAYRFRSIAESKHEDLSILVWRGEKQDESHPVLRSDRVIAKLRAVKYCS